MVDTLAEKLLGAGGDSFLDFLYLTEEAEICNQSNKRLMYIPFWLESCRTKLFTIVRRYIHGD